jgi:hypothetical protein
MLFVTKSVPLPQGLGCVLPMIRSAMVIGRLAQSLELSGSDGDRTRRQPPASRLGVWDLAISGLVVRIGKRIDSRFNGREIAPAAARWSREYVPNSIDRPGSIWDCGLLGLATLLPVWNRGPCSTGGPVPSSRSNLSIDGAATHLNAI